MSLRRRHTEAEIRKLADHFQESWSDGQLIKSWLRDHADELRELVKHGDWAWINIGKAMTLAGIRYQTGKPWSGEGVRKEVIKASAPKKSRKTAYHAILRTNVQSPPAPYVPNTEEPEFKLIRPKQKTSAASQSPILPGSPIPRPPKRELSEDDVWRLIFGKPRTEHR